MSLQLRWMGDVDASIFPDPCLYDQAMAKGSVLANTLPANAKVWSPQKGRKQHKLISIKTMKLLVLPLSWFPASLKTGFAWFCKVFNSSNITESLGISHTPCRKCREKIWKQIIQLINHWLLNWLFIDRIDYSSRIHWVSMDCRYWLSIEYPIDSRIDFATDCPLIGYLVNVFFMFRV